MSKTPLERILKRAGLSAATPPATVDEWRTFLACTTSALEEHIERREIYENALIVSAREMESLYQELKVRSEGELEESRSFLSAMIDALPVGLFCKDFSDDFRFILWNKRAETIYGMTASQVLRHDDFELFSRTEALAHRAIDIEATANPGVVNVSESTIRLRDSAAETHIKVHKVAVLSHGASPKYVLGVVEDITEQLDARGKLVESAKFASLGEMAGGIAHEINNPVAIIHGSATILLRLMEKSGTIQPAMKANAEQIVRTCDRIEHIIKGLSSFARNGDADPMRLEDLRDVIDAALSLCGERLRNSGVELRLSVPDAPVKGVCRQVQVGQVLVNLINNAFDAVKPLPVKWIALQVEERTDVIVISVTDSGGGIPEAAKRKIMQPFFTTKGFGKGTGLGLSISKKIIEQHHGTLEYDSKSLNTRFVIALPKNLTAPTGVSGFGP